uniref:Protein FMC1 homolog n=1 Tax=Cacopsylla melanoneura TaxID=428564 RepID=A0A8D9B6D5_9HEMI
MATLNYTSKVSVLRKLVSELRKVHNIQSLNKVSPTTTYLKDQDSIKYIFNQYRKNQVTDEQVCKEQESMNYLVNTYLCYLSSKRTHEQIVKDFHSRGERSVQDTADLVGFTLPPTKE